MCNKNNSFKWALVAVYGPAQDNFKESFLSELVNMCSWLRVALGSSLIRYTNGFRYRGSIYRFEEMIHELVIAKTWLLLIINTRRTKSNNFEPHPTYNQSTSAKRDIC
jgi:hypothetical protein